ncbi:MAG: MoaD/ThiS family protein [Chthoniobacterales bacterium]
MKVRVQFFSRLKDIVAASELELDVPKGTTAGELLSRLYDQHPPLREWNSSILIGAGVEFVDRDYVLQADQDIAVMPPVQGG